MTSGGPVTLNYIGPLDPGGTNVAAAKECSEQSGGQYKIAMSPVGNSADATRELFVRRLAAGDKNMDIINMDTIYTPEFAEAGWMTEMTGANKEDALDDVLHGPAESVTWKDKVYGIPTNTNVQLLWYRKDLVPKPPETWDEMIEMAKKLPPGEGNILEQGQKYEGYVVWFNNLVASGRRRDRQRRRRAGAQRGRGQGGDDHQRRRDRPVAPTRRCRRAGGPVAPRLRGRQGRLPAQLAVRLRRRARGRGDRSEVTKKVFENMGYARWPGVNKGEPSKVSIGGANLGVPKTGKHPELAIEAALCMTSEKWQAQEAIKEGLPPVMNSVYDDAEVRKVYPFADLLREQLKDSVVRPPTPSYSDVTLAIQDTLHPPASIDPQKSIDTLRDRLNILADGGMY